MEIYKKGHGRVHPLTIPKTMANAGASHISMEFGITGPSFTISTACSSSNHAIGQAFWMVRSGVTDAGDHGRQRGALQHRHSEGVGSDARGVARHLPSVFEGSPRDDSRRGRRRCWCWSRWTRRGRAARGSMQRSSASGCQRTRATSRSLRPRARPGQCERRCATRDPPEQVGYINAHGTGDHGERSGRRRAAIRAVFGAHAEQAGDELDKIDARPCTGRGGRARSRGDGAGAARGVLPPTANYREPDPECDLDVIPNQARAGAGRVRAIELIRVRRSERGAGVSHGGLRNPRANMLAAGHQAVPEGVSDLRAGYVAMVVDELVGVEVVDAARFETVLGAEGAGAPRLPIPWCAARRCGRCRRRGRSRRRARRRLSRAMREASG